MVGASFESRSGHQLFWLRIFVVFLNSHKANSRILTSLGTELLGFWTIPSSGILENRKYDVSERDPVSETSCFYFPKYRTMESVQNPSNSVCYTPPSQPFRMYFIRPWPFRSNLSLIYHPATQWCIVYPLTDSQNNPQRKRRVYHYLDGQEISSFLLPWPLNSVLSWPNRRLLHSTVGSKRADTLLHLHLASVCAQL
jgi:hypothetical protein